MCFYTYKEHRVLNEELARAKEEGEIEALKKKINTWAPCLE